MGKAIATNKIGGDLYCEGDLIFDALALADTAAVTSSEFLLAQTMGAQEIKVMANGAVATGAGETLVVTVVTADASGGTFNDTIFTYTVAASTTIADGDKICSFIAPRETSEIYTKVIVTSDFDALALKVDAYIVGVC